MSDTVSEHDLLDSPNVAQHDGEAGQQVAGAQQQGEAAASDRWGSSPQRGEQTVDTADPGTGAAQREPGGAGVGAGADAGGGAGVVNGREGGSLLIQEGDIAADYLERLLDIVDYDGDIDLDVENDRAIVAIIGNDLRPLVGVRGETLDALQELTRLAVAQKTGSRSRLMLDVSGHRQARRAELSAIAAESAARVLESGTAARLAPMNPFERKVLHDAIAGLDGVRSESEGEEPNRRVVVLPAVD